MSNRYIYAASFAAITIFTGATLVACSTNTSTDQISTGNEPSPTTIKAAVEPETPTVDVKVEVKDESIVKHRRIKEVIVTAGRTLSSADQAAEPVPHALAHKSATGLPYPASIQHGVAPMYQDIGRERYEVFADNGIFWANQNPVSTFSLDVDTASYANMRRQLNGGSLPAPDSIRVEELVNYFSYAYPKAETQDRPFSIYTEMGPSPWHTDRKLVHIGINGWNPLTDGDMPPANLVFLIDVSGSMQAPNKIYLLKNALRMMVNQMRPQDTISIAVYAGAAGEVLSPTPGDQKSKIFRAIENLQAGGSTNGGAGIRLAYDLAAQNLKSDGINRVILATDGDFNVGTTSVDELERLAEVKRKTGVALTVLGFGTGNYNDQLMQKIAQAGNGNAAYIDNLNEARKVLVEELGATLNIIAKDMKVQIEFNPEVVETYRLIGYETRHLNREDFNNDKIDAGDVGAGHTVTALYEVTLAGQSDSIADPLRYQSQADITRRIEGELGFLKLRYKNPRGSESKLITQPLLVNDITTNLSTTSESYRFAGAVAWLGQVLRGNDQVVAADLNAIVKLAREAKGQDPHGYRAEFINLVKTAQALDLASVLHHNPSDQG
ncbi:MAG: DUF3520 domain-containing protein [Pseudomonadales bacterium]|nr:DUF3520 domain-containing protein [Pseudomonadales bacterium]